MSESRKNLLSRREDIGFGKSPTEEQIVMIPEDIAVRARRSLERMYELEKKQLKEVLVSE